MFTINPLTLEVIVILKKNKGFLDNPNYQPRNYYNTYKALCYIDLVNPKLKGIKPNIPFIL